jgi:hypothetical protein
LVRVRSISSGDFCISEFSIFNFIDSRSGVG